MNDDNATAKNTTLELTVDPGYVQGWGFFHALREFLQNALDGHDRNFPMTITRGTGEKKTIRITNEGTTLSRRTLLLGSSDKRGSSQRGQFGEGYKLAMLVFARAGIDMQIRTGDEMWTPYIEKSASFGGELLKVKIRQQPKFENKVEVQIHGIDDETWNTLQSKMLNVPGLSATTLKEDEYIQVGGNKILTDARFMSMLFCRGIFVCRTTEDLNFGYDLENLKLDRDRKLADPYSVQSEVTQVLSSALEQRKLDAEKIYFMLCADSGESKIIAQYVQWSSNTTALSDAIVTQFEKVHGEGTVPVQSMAESMVAEQQGMKSAVVPEAVRRLVEKEKGTFESRKEKRAFECSKIYASSDLDEGEKFTYSWAMRLLDGIVFNLPMVNIVDFFGEGVNGTYGAEGVRVARRQLKNRKDFISTLVHEMAHHRGGDDGSAEHRQNIQDIFSEIVVKAAKE